MLRLVFISLSLLIWPAIGFAKVAATIVEAAPLQGALGQVAVRLERPWQETVGLAFQVENRPVVGERDDRRDVYRKASVEAIKYPMLWDLDGFFIGAGLSYEQAEISRRRERDYVSTIRYSEDERYDKWVNEEHNFSAHATAGYRFFLGKRVTASLRYVHDSLLQRYSEVRRESVYSFNPDLSTNGRPRQQGRLSLYAGFSLD